MKNFKIFIFLLPVLAFSACESVLDVTPRSQVTSANFFKTAEDIQLAVNGVYYKLSGHHDINGGLWRHLQFNAHATTDDGVGGGFFGWMGDHKRGTVAADNFFVGAVWNDLFNIIRRSNVVLEAIENADQSINQDIIDQARGELLFIRSYCYYHLVFNYGDVPYLAQASGVNAAELARTPAEDVIDNISVDLETAADLLPISYTDDIGRTTRGAAYTLQSRVYLYAGRNQEASATAKKVMDLGVYDLFQDPSGEGYRTLHQLENENNEEVIFDFQYVESQANDNALGTYGEVTLHATSGWAWANTWMQADQSLVDAFEDNTGLEISDPSSVYDASQPFENRDPRLNMAIIAEGGIIHDPIQDIDVTVPVNAAASGYWPKKVYQDSYGTGNADEQLGFNMVILRYAEVLLNYAEAKVEAGQVDNTVLDAINAVRARAYNTTPDDTSNYPEISTTDPNQLRKIIRRERRVEFCFETDHRLQDIRRWRIAEDVILNGEMGVGGRVIADPSVMTFDPNRDYLWPIPQADLDRMPLMTQNPNY